MQQGISFLCAKYLRLVYQTSRHVVTGREKVEDFLQGHKAAIIVFWHREMMMAPFAWKKGTKFRMLISSHGDGRLVAKTVQRFGIECIEGSSSHERGVFVLKKMLDTLSEGISVGITPDGPRGPKGVLKDGVYALARLSGCPVLTLRWNSTTEYILKKTWDQMKLPLPFGRIEWIWGSPITLAHADTQSIFYKSIYAMLS